MRLLPLVLSFLIFALPSKAGSVFTCWDVSYNMKYARLVESDKRFELAITGMSLGDLKFAHFNEVIGDEAWRYKKIYTQFAKDQCTIDKATKSGHCEKSGNILWDAFFVERQIDNLGEWVNTITALPALKITADFTPEKIKVEFHGAYYPGYGRDVQTIEFDLKQCYEPDSYVIEFPQPLKDYLNKWYP